MLKKFLVGTIIVIGFTLFTPIGLLGIAYAALAAIEEF